MDKLDTFVSVIAIASDAAPFTFDDLEALHQVLSSSYTTFEIVVVDDHGAKDARTYLDPLLSRLPFIRVLRLSRVMGIEISILAGLESAIGDFVVTMLLGVDPPAEVPGIVSMCTERNDIVIGKLANSPSSGFAFRLLRRGFYVLSGWLIRSSLIEGATAFRGFSRQAVNALTRVRQRHRNFSLLLGDIGFDVTRHLYSAQAGNTRPYRPSIFRSLRLGLHLLLSYSDRLVKAGSLLGLAGSLVSFAYACYAVIIRLVLADVVPGWTTLSLQISGLFVILFIILAILGESVARLLEESSDRPLYHAYPERTSSVLVTDTNRRNVLGHSDIELNNPSKSAQQKPQ